MEVKSRWIDEKGQRHRLFFDRRTNKKFKI